MAQFGPFSQFLRQKEFFQKNWLSCTTFKSGRLHASCAHMPTCLACLYALVQMCLVCLHALVPTCLACSHVMCLHAYVSTCLACLHGHMPVCLTCLACSHANVPCMPKCWLQMTKIVFQWHILLTFLALFLCLFPVK